MKLTSNPWRLATLLFEQAAADGGAGGQGGDGAGAAGAGAGAAAGTTVNPGTGGNTNDGQSGTQRTGAAATGFSYQEDRSKWIPPHRFNEVSEQAKAAKRYETELATTRAQLQALTGATPPDPNAAKEDQVRAAFLKLHPQLEPLLSLTKEQIAQLAQTPSQLEGVRAAEIKQWERFGNAQVAEISKRIAEAIGAETLTPRQQSGLRNQFSTWLKSTCQTEIETTGDSPTLRAYEDGDNKVLDAFVTVYTEDWVTPARRQNVAQNINRTRPVPNSQGRSQVTSVQRPETFKTLDERIAYAADLAKERGVQFGR